MRIEIRQSKNYSATETSFLINSQKSLLGYILSPPQKIKKRAFYPPLISLDISNPLRVLVLFYSTHFNLLNWLGKDSQHF